MAGAFCVKIMSSYKSYNDLPLFLNAPTGNAPGYLSPVGIEKIKSILTHDNFRQEMLHVYEQKSRSRDELVAET